MSIHRVSPGVCPICGSAHTACTTTLGPVTAVQLPARDAATLTQVPLVAEVVQERLPPGQFTTATYRGKPKK